MISRLSIDAEYDAFVRRMFNRHDTTTEADFRELPHRLQGVYGESFSLNDPSMLGMLGHYLGEPEIRRLEDLSPWDKRRAIVFYDQISQLYPREWHLEQLAEVLQQAEAALAEADYAAAIVSFNAALQIDPENPECTRRLKLAAESYRIQQEKQERWNQAIQDFDQGNYRAALAYFYRLPEEEHDATLVGRVNGLRAGYRVALDLLLRIGEVGAPRAVGPTRQGEECESLNRETRA